MKDKFKVWIQFQHLIICFVYAASIYRMPYYSATAPNILMFDSKIDADIYGSIFHPNLECRDTEPRAKMQKKK